MNLLGDFIRSKPLGAGVHIPPGSLAVLAQEWANSLDTRPAPADPVAQAEAKAKEADALAAARRAALKAAVKARAQAEREKALAEAAKALAEAFHARLEEDESRAVATRALIQEVRTLAQGQHSPTFAPPSIARHVDELDALAKSYGYKLIRTGPKVVVVKA